MKRWGPLLILILLCFGYWSFLHWRKDSRLTGANVIFITVDTLRFDHTPFGRYSRSTMPATAEFFREGINFARAETVRTSTTPAYSSMLTGLYPYRHGVRQLYFPLHQNVRTLQEDLQKRGYLTAGFVSSFVMIGRFSGLNQGFDTYDDLVLERELSRENYERTSKNTVDHVVQWLANVPRRKPFFLFLHFIDPHSPYHPPPPFATQFKSGQEKILERNEIPDNTFVQPVLNQYQYLDWYDGEISYLDSQLDRLYSIFKRDKFIQNSWFLFVADHGESLGDHGIYFQHGNGSLEAQSRIPMVWLPPFSLRSTYKPAIRQEVVSLVDVVPTIFDALGIVSRPNLDGESLLSTMIQGKQKNRVRFIERITGKQREYAVVDQRFKLVKCFDKDQTKAELYDLIKDPQEQTNLIDSLRVPPELSQALDSYIQKSNSYKLGFQVKRVEVKSRTDFIKEHAEHSENSLSKDDLEKLKALGYAQ
jgi:arylsulfatase A-like enzyme